MIFSIIMPIYNTEQYLAEAIESVLNQTFTDFEFILINDGSTDNSLEIATSFKNMDARIQLFSQENKGISGARNKGLGLAKGEYIYFLDSDDWILKNTLVKIYEKLKIKKYDVVCFTAKPFIIEFKTPEENDKILRQYTKYYERTYLREKEYTADRYLEEMYINHNFVATGCLYVFKSSLVSDNNLEYMDGILFEDNLFTREILYYAKNIYFIPKKLLQRRIRPGSIVTAKINEKTPYSYLKISEQLFNLAIQKENNIYLHKGANLFFGRVVQLISEEFNDSIELKSKLFSLHKKLNLNKYKNEILVLKYPILKPLVLFGRKIKNKLGIQMKIKTHY